jgi:signal recognition particle GTPase
MATKGKSARVKGHSFERDMVKFFRDLGFEKCNTSRFESKMKDDQGIDLTNTDPLSVQCKAVEKLGSMHDILDSMPKDTNWNIVLHKKNRKGTIVAMDIEDFREIIQSLITNQIIKP